MKEFRSLLAFAEFSHRPILAVFSDGGAPMTLSVSQGPLLTSTYVLATLEGDEIVSEASQPTLVTSPSGGREGAPASQLTPVSSVSSSQQAEIEKLEKTAVEQRKKIRCLTKALRLKNAEVRGLKYIKLALTTKLTSQEEALAKITEEMKTLEETYTELSRGIKAVKSLLLEDSDSDTSNQ